MFIFNEPKPFTSQNQPLYLFYNIMSVVHLLVLFAHFDVFKTEA